MFPKRAETTSKFLAETTDGGDFSTISLLVNTSNQENHYEQVQYSNTISLEVLKHRGKGLPNHHSRAVFVMAQDRHLFRHFP